jgi:hypothetical protein
MKLYVYIPAWKQLLSIYVHHDNRLPVLKLLI